MARKIRRKDNTPAHIKAGRKAQAGIDRREHFAAGKTPAMWRPRRTITTDRRKEASRKACRGRVR